MRFNTIDDLRDFLKGRIFTIEDKGVYLFDENTYAVLPGNFSLFMERSAVPWEAVKHKYRYSIFQYESNFVIRTYKNELNSGSNEFIIEAKRSRNMTNTVTLISVVDKNDRIYLLSD